MAQQLTSLVAQYGLLLIFLNVLLDQIGLPVPSTPILVIAGALAASGHLPLLGIIPVALIGCLIPDLLWYWAGRHFGGRVIRMLCRISLSPDSCARRSELHFQRWGGWTLVIAKFVPGLSMVAPPLVGALGLRLSMFVQLDGLGSLLWIGLATVLGYVFAGQIDPLLWALSNVSMFALAVILCLLVLYVGIKWWRRRHLRIALQMMRITPAELHQALSSGYAPLVIDVRSQVARQLDPRVIDGALMVDADLTDGALQGVPLDRGIVSYCNCPNEATSAKVANALIEKGYRNVRPLLGGLDAWVAAGYPIRRLSGVTGLQPELHPHG